MITLFTHPLLNPRDEVVKVIIAICINIWDVFVRDGCGESLREEFVHDSCVGADERKNTWCPSIVQLVTAYLDEVLDQVFAWEEPAIMNIRETVTKELNWLKQDKVQEVTDMVELNND